MRIAIISDIHSNLEALTKAFEIIGKKDVREIICLGDIVGYGANPNECISLIRSKARRTLLGNHDEAVFQTVMAYNFNQHARSAVLWTSRQLTSESISFLQSLPVTLEHNDAFFTHASPRIPNEWNYILTAEDAEANMPHFSQNICFIGHSHVPAIFCEGKQTSQLERGKKHIVNVGSVGQPRDLDPRLSFGIFDTEAFTYENVRIDYDVEKASEKILQAGLPRSLADRLLVGK